MREFSPLLVPLIEITKFHIQYGRLQAVQTAVVSDLGVSVSFDLRVVPQHADLVREVGVVGRDTATVTEGTEILRRIERKRGRVSERSGLSPLIVTSLPLTSTLKSTWWDSTPPTRLMEVSPLKLTPP